MIALIGFMGAGKSTVAEALSIKRNLPLYPTDELVFKLSGLSNMQQIFTRGGDSYLRELEQKTLENLSRTDDGIIDCGGGIITHQPSLELLQQIADTIILLDVSFEMSRQRIGDDNSRPLFADEDKARQLYLSRQDQYKKSATHTIKIHGQTTQELVREIEELMP